MRNTSRKIDLTRTNRSGSLKVEKGADGWTSISLYNTKLAEISFSGKLKLMGTDWTTHTTVMAFNTILKEANWGEYKIYKKGDGLALYYCYSDIFEIFEEVQEIEKGQIYDIQAINADFNPDFNSLNEMFKNKLLRALKGDIKDFFNGKSYSRTLEDLKRKCLNSYRMPHSYNNKEGYSFDELFEQAGIAVYRNKETFNLAKMLDHTVEQFN